MDTILYDVFYRNKIIEYIEKIENLKYHEAKIVPIDIKKEDLKNENEDYLKQDVNLKRYVIEYIVFVIEQFIIHFIKNNNDNFEKIKTIIKETRDLDYFFAKNIEEIDIAMLNFFKLLNEARDINLFCYTDATTDEIKRIIFDIFRNNSQLLSNNTDKLELNTLQDKNYEKILKIQDRIEILKDKYIVKQQKENLDLVNKLKYFATQSAEFAKSYSWKAILCFIFALVWFCLCEFVDFSKFHLFSIEFGKNIIFNLFHEQQQIYKNEIFIFLSKIILKLPAIILCYVGIKFLNLFVNYKTEERELYMLDSYLDKIKSQDKKDELTKQLASHFFPDKKSTKISQSFLQELMFKMIDKKQEN